jgi:hypothetical protein
MKGQGDIAGVGHPSPNPFPQGKGGLGGLVPSEGNFYLFEKFVGMLG